MVPHPRLALLDSGLRYHRRFSDGSTRHTDLLGHRRPERRDRLDGAFFAFRAAQSNQNDVSISFPRRSSSSARCSSAGNEKFALFVLLFLIIFVALSP